MRQMMQQKTQQKTLAGAVLVSGVGVHSGHTVRLVLQPAAANSGVVFRRVDLSPPVEIPARLAAVSSTERCTTLTACGASVATVEHLLAALSGLGIDNALIEIDAGECPAMDGSAAPFVDLIRAVGCIDQGVMRRSLIVLEDIEVSDGDKWARLGPADSLRMMATLDYDHPLASGAKAQFEVEIDEDQFCSQLAPARTFALESELRALHDRGLAKGGSLDNAILLDAQGCVNSEGLRFPNELVRHKLLDALGDLSLIGFSVQGAYSSFKGGHTLNHRLLTRLLETPAAWRLSDSNRVPDTDVAPALNAAQLP